MSKFYMGFEEMSLTPFLFNEITDFLKTTLKIVQFSSFSVGGETYVGI